MCDGRVLSSLQKTMQSVATRVPKIVVQRSEEVFPSLKEIVDSVYSQKDVGILCSHSEACSSSSHSGDQTVSIKVEELSHVQDGQVPATVEGIKAEHENCLESQKDVPDFDSEACPSSPSHDGDQAVNIKIEEFSDMKNGEDPVPMTFLEIKAKHETCAQSQEDVPGSGIETRSTSSHDEIQTISVKDEEVSDVEVEEDPLPISFPEIKAEDASVLNEHQHIHSESQFPSDMCNKSFAHSSGLKRQHINAAERSFSCNVCSKSFTRPGHLKEHQRTHSGERPYSCRVCDKSFSRQSYLKVHQDTHSWKRAFSCAVCNKSFNTKSVLTVHKRIHSDERPFSCAVCNESYLYKSQVKVHLRRHSGERPFSCDICSKSYTDSSSLKIHQRIHSGERPFSCDMCNGSYASKHRLKEHLRKHSGERPFTCDVCNKSFAISSNLKAHQRIHSGERPFSCDVCNMSFTSSSNRKAHQRRH